MRYNELAMKIVDRFADGKPRCLADMCEEIMADSIYFLRAVEEINGDFTQFLTPNDYDSRKGPLIIISEMARSASPEELFCQGGTDDAKAGGDIEEDDDDVPAGGPAQGEGIEKFFTGMARNVHTMVMLEMMCNNVSSAAMWMVGACKNNDFGDDTPRIMEAARKILAAVSQIKD